MNESTLLTVGAVMARQYTHYETLFISGVTNDTLMTWFKREILPAYWRYKPGRGNRRKYEGSQVAFLYAMKATTEAGVTLAEAVKIAQSIMGTVVVAFDDLKSLPYEVAAERMLSLDPARRMYYREQPAAPDSLLHVAEDRSGLPEWATVFDCAVIGRRLLLRMTNLVIERQSKWSA